MCYNTVRMNSHHDNLTLEELSREVERLLRTKGIRGDRADHRVSSIPDARTIRYYTTLGILDRPRAAGREARYNARHLLQILVIKALQVMGMPLTEIQTRIYGRSDEELQAIINAVEKVQPREEVDVRVVKWHEVVLQPGLKLMVEEDWSGDIDPGTLEKRIYAAVAAVKSLSKSSERSKNNG